MGEGTRSPEEIAEAARMAHNAEEQKDDQGELIGVDSATGQVVGKYKSRKEAAEAATRRREAEK